MKRLQPFLVVVIILFSAISCSDNSVSPELESLFGTYEMTRVDGNNTPFIVTETDSTILIYTGGWLTLHEDGRYEMETEVQTRIYDNGNKTTYRRRNWGHYEYRSDSLYFEPVDQDLYSNFTGYVQGDQRQRIQIGVYGAEYIFELFTVDQSFEEESKAKRIESALENLQLNSSVSVPVNWEKWSTQ